MRENYPEQLFDTIFVARQPIFTADMQVWVYELFFRNGEDLPLDPGIKAALVDPSSQNALWVDFLDEIDRCNWARLSQKAAQLGISIPLISRLSAKVSIWTNEVMAEHVSWRHAPFFTANRVRASACLNLYCLPCFSSSRRCSWGCVWAVFTTFACIAT